MSLLELAKKRYSVRKYEDRAVESEKLEKIIFSEGLETINREVFRKDILYGALNSIS